jgi:hypothetical protein
LIHYATDTMPTPRKILQLFKQDGAVTNYGHMLTAAVATVGLDSTIEFTCTDLSNFDERAALIIASGHGGAIWDMINKSSRPLLQKARRNTYKLTEFGVRMACLHLRRPDHHVAALRKRDLRSQ